MIILTRKKRPCITVPTNEKKSEPNQGGNTVNMYYEFADSLHAKSYKNTRERGLTVDQKERDTSRSPAILESRDLAFTHL